MSLSTCSQLGLCHSFFYSLCLILRVRKVCGHVAEASLVAVDPLLGKLRNKIRHVDAEILAAVRQQVLMWSFSRTPLQAHVDFFL